MSIPFDAIAADYTDLWSETPNGLDQRHQVWKEIDDLFPSESHILDLGCGIGDDALHLRARNVRVTAIDASREMARIARKRGLDAHHLRIEQLAEFNGTFHGALSNFGAFNCISNPAVTAADLAERLCPGAPFAMCVLSRFYWRETLALNFRRWTGRTIWRGLEVHYRTSREWRSAFTPHFTLVRRLAIGGGDHKLYIWSRT